MEINDALRKKRFQFFFCINKTIRVLYFPNFV